MAPRPLRSSTRRLLILVAVVAVLLGGGRHAWRWQRLRLAAGRFAASQAFYDEGRMTADRLVEASRRVMDAELALCSTRPRRIAALTLHIARADRIIAADRRVARGYYARCSWNDGDDAETEEVRDRLALLRATAY